MRISAVLTATILLLISAASPSWAQEQTSEQEQAVRAIVSEFGMRLRMVAVLAPKDITGKAMDQAYSPFVAPELLAAWKTILKVRPASGPQVLRRNASISRQSRPRGMAHTSCTGSG